MPIRYIPGSELTLDEIHAGSQTGAIRKWRKDSVTGEWWYAIGSAEIHGVPPEDAAEQAAIEAAEDEFLATINDEDDLPECEFVDGDDDNV